MAAPLASITFQNAIVFQSYATLSRKFDKDIKPTDPPSFRGVIFGGFGAGAIQSLIVSPIELVKINLQLQRQTNDKSSLKGPADIVRIILNREGWRGIYRGFTITVLRDVPSHAFYFSTYEYIREKLHPGCRKNGQETFGTMLVAGGLAGVVSWMSCYPLDVIKTRIQSQSNSTPLMYRGIVDCFRRSVKNEGWNVLWRGLGTTLTRAFIVNGAVFTGYETALRLLFTNNF
ncbi:hypothetical protein Leryth_001604 [Lithospermum erythrorhizon]|nr:hypothetical protein Leryth_001604 [Lithospermum erythrorhizon]